eukprot:TRINITY_DN6146_c0_g2_i8.p2 TRINITY_DN6146_c0_g2~~TRINITY_DN6146_c0_g2_i8.p2  ORF type:complete len:134 (-),score=19.04 TRINITY_DN6146_c0_g2_i8:775-1176(-)
MLVGVVLGILLLFLFFRFSRKANKTERSVWDYAELKRLVNDVSLPAMIVSLPELDRNIDEICKVAVAGNKTVRLATKSVRVPKLIQYILKRGSPTINGVMTYSAMESLFLAENYGVDDFLVGYPTMTLKQLAS